MRLKILLSLAIALSAVSVSAQSQRAASTQSGRFYIFHNPSIRADTFLVDSETGSVWYTTRYSDVVNDPAVWIKMERLDSRAELDAWERKQQLKKP